ncbi:MAG TPA: M23 family peptidase [Acidobacterium sp.]|uniref:Peptidase M23B family, nonpeptidase homolog n=1 Tax=Acidobacterium capsulatum (strain ATCC 51196 / DSM 11244 / BCRC 80197 / JCM 7670 / NBRC 15755 / NCIMB 13165 / 161) TaxID=240015 RepID=C1F3X0_ACIC5|nr:peptidase M23B family, nonpeptidase homolog [Acidobacterium capsulatum ATCC 51196]HCT60507.1 M23 family peptidase [Acidobacterium sp.]
MPERLSASRKFFSGQAVLFKKRYYIIFVAREEDGRLRKIPIPMRYAYIFVAAAVVGAFTITGMAGSYTRMLLKTARFNQVRSQQVALQKDYQNLQVVAHEKEVQAATLGSLASEVAALYGLSHGHISRDSAVTATSPLSDASNVNFTEQAYERSLNELSSLRSTALAGGISNSMEMNLLNTKDGGGWADFASAPALWPITGRVTSAFGERQDPVRTGETEFHTGIDIAASYGQPVHATANGVVELAGEETGYGRMVILNNGHGIQTYYAHLSGFAVTEGERVHIGEVIGYVGESGRVTGPNLHYEVRIHNTPVNPHPFMHETMRQLAASGGVVSAAAGS